MKNLYFNETKEERILQAKTRMRTDLRNAVPSDIRKICDI